MYNDDEEEAGPSAIEELMGGKYPEPAQPDLEEENAPESDKLQAQAVAAYSRRFKGVPKAPKVPSPGLGGKPPKQPGGAKTNPRKYSYPPAARSPRRRRGGARYPGKV